MPPGCHGAPRGRPRSDRDGQEDRAGLRALLGHFKGRAVVASRLARIGPAMRSLARRPIAQIGAAVLPASAADRVKPGRESVGTCDMRDASGATPALRDTLAACRLRRRPLCVLPTSHRLAPTAQLHLCSFP
jgi:hypothetical protein